MRAACLFVDVTCHAGLTQSKQRIAAVSVLLSCILVAQERVSVQPGRERAAYIVLFRSYLYMILGVHLELARAYGLAMREYADNVVSCTVASIFLDADNDVCS